MNKIISTTLVSAAMTMALTAPVMADGQTGQYGSTTETPDKPREEVTHETVDAGLGDIAFLQYALIAGIAGAAFFGLAKVTRNAYLFD